MESSLITSFFKPLRPPSTAHTPSEAAPTPPHTSKTRPTRTGGKSHKKKKKSKVKGHPTLSSMGVNDNHVCLESCDSEGVVSDGVERVVGDGVECVEVSDGVECVEVSDGVECVEVSDGSEWVEVSDGVECDMVKSDESLVCCVSLPVRPMASCGHMGLVHVRQCDPTDELWSLQSHITNDSANYPVATPTSSCRELCDWTQEKEAVHELPVSTSVWVCLKGGVTAHTI